jgi:uncharacterized membrane protein
MGWPARPPVAQGRHEPRGAGGTGCLRRFRRHDVTGPAGGPAATPPGRRSAAHRTGNHGLRTPGARRRRWSARIGDAFLIREARPLGSAGAVLGIGLGGLFDAIVLGDLLQFHHVLPGREPGVMRFWDGMLELPAWLAIAAGVALLFRVARWREVPWSGRILVGAMLFGWGLAQFAEGVILHHVLGLHHWLEGVVGSRAWDWAFLAGSVAVMAIGWSLARAPVRHIHPAAVLPAATRFRRHA